VCGIVGAINTGPGTISNDEIEVMLDKVMPRGPDHRGVTVCRALGFGHSRLSILDLSARGNQPFMTPDGQGLLVYNGEVYNFRELRRELEGEGVQFQSGTDTEVVLHALHSWGALRAVPRFNGMFAFAYADFRTGTVWLARDRLGIKPLFTARTANRYLFASEQKALLAHPRVSTDIDVQSTLSLLLYERFNDTETPYRAVRNFPPGAIAQLSDGGLEIHTYFDVARDIDVSVIADTTRRFSDTSRAVEGALIESVERHMISDAPLATLCSGGLDSGLVTAIAARQNPALVSYVADMEGMQGEEFRRASLVAKHVGAELRRVPIGQRDFLRALPHTIAANDQPLFFAQEVALFLIARQMHADGFKATLSGDGADELFGGYTWYADEYRRWSRLALRSRWLPDLSLMRRLARFVPALRKPVLHQQIADYALTGHPIEYVATSFNMVPVGGMTRTLRQRELFDRLQRLPLPERAFLARNFEDVYVHMRESLNAKDKVTMHHGIEGRVPFMENTLIQLGLNLPVAHKYHRGNRKAVIGHMASQWLPREVLNLPKIGFTAPPVMWQNTLELLRDGHVARLLNWPRDQHDEIVRLLRPRRYYCFRLLGCELWLRLHHGEDSAEGLAEQLVNCAMR